MPAQVQLNDSADQWRHLALRELGVLFSQMVPLDRLNIPSLPVHDTRLPLLHLFHQCNDLGIGDKEALWCLHRLAGVLAGLKQTSGSITYLVLALNQSLQGATTIWGSWLSSLYACVGEWVRVCACMCVCVYVCEWVCVCVHVCECGVNETTSGHKSICVLIYWHWNSA